MHAVVAEWLEHLRDSQRTTERFRVKSEANDWSSDDRQLKGGVSGV